MSIYDFDIELQIKRLTPTRKRTQDVIDWVVSLVRGTKKTQEDFKAYRDDTLRTLSYNSQTLIFNKLLNDSCDPTLARIYIDNSADDLEDSYMYFIEENQEDAFCYDLSEEPFNGRYMYSIQEYRSPYDFTVNVPTDLAGKEATIRSLVNFYKLAGKRYIIKYF